MLINRLKELCDKHGETFASLERRMDFGNGTIRRWANTTPSADKLAKVADFFGVSVDYLMGRTDDDSDNQGAFFRLKKGLEPLGLDDDDTDFLLTVYRAHKEKNK